MVPKFESKEEMKKFLEKELSAPNPYFSNSDLLRVVYQLLNFAPSDDEIQEMVENEVSDRLESIEFRAVNLEIIGR